jgi:COP9 signalosome complex subunit 5|tara:strand:+ start:146 stop:724 length:579 start_codon:yes stop_codon:yes gene_type:complete
MSGIDCSTQTLNQQYTEPFLAIVLDPIRTCCSGKVELGAYRTYPQSYIPPKKKMYKYVVPINKSLDFGAHAKKYYSLETSLFKSHHDSNLLVALWNTCWINTLSLACIQTNHDYASKQIFDVTQKLEEGEELRVRRGRTCTVVVPDLATSCPNDMSHALHVTHDAIRLSSERIKGTAAFTLKELLFNKTPKL